MFVTRKRFNREVAYRKTAIAVANSVERNLWARIKVLGDIVYDRNNEITALSAKNMGLMSELAAIKKASRPVKNKAGRWMNPKTGDYVKVPDPVEEEALARAKVLEQSRKRAEKSYCLGNKFDKEI